MNFSEIGKRIEEYTEKEGTLFANALCAPLRVHGLWYSDEDGTFRRVTKEAAEATSEAVKGYSKQCTGGRVRFRTDSPYVAVRMKNERFWPDFHITLTGIAGVDVYDGNEFRGVLAHDLEVDK